MSYDWKEKVKQERFTLSWFDEVDRRFFHAARLFATTTQPFDRIIPFSSLKDREVLEIGCGMGLHAELMVRAGARVTAMDLSPTSVESRGTGHRCFIASSVHPLISQLMLIQIGPQKEERPGPSPTNRGRIVDE